MISKRRRAVTLPAALLLGLVTLLAGMTAAPAAAAAEAPVDLRAFAPFDVQVVPGQTYDFRMSGQAMTPDTVDGATVRMSMTLPAGVSYVSVGAPCEGAGCRPESGPCEMSGSVLRCVVTDPGAITGAPYQDTAPYQGFYQFTAKLRIGADVPVGTRLAFPVSITGAGEESTPADNTATGRATVVAGADLGLTVEKLTGPAGPRNTVSYTLVVRNYGPSTVPRFGISEGFESFWNSGGTSFDGPNAECITEAVGTTTCVIRQRLAPGQTYRLKRTITVRADDPVWGTRQRVVAGAVDVPENANFTDGHGLGCRAQVAGLGCRAQTRWASASAVGRKPAGRPPQLSGASRRASASAVDVRVSCRAWRCGGTLPRSGAVRRRGG